MSIVVQPILFGISLRKLRRLSLFFAATYIEFLPKIFCLEFGNIKKFERKSSNSENYEIIIVSRNCMSNPT